MSVFENFGLKRIKKENRIGIIMQFNVWQTEVSNKLKIIRTIDGAVYYVLISKCSKWFMASFKHPPNKLSRNRNQFWMKIYWNKICCWLIQIKARKIGIYQLSIYHLNEQPTFNVCLTEKLVLSLNNLYDMSELSACLLMPEYFVTDVFRFYLFFLNSFKKLFIACLKKKLSIIVSVNNPIVIFSRSFCCCCCHRKDNWWSTNWFTFDLYHRDLISSSFLASKCQSWCCCRRCSSFCFWTFFIVYVFFFQLLFFLFAHHLS